MVFFLKHTLHIIDLLFKQKKSSIVPLLVLALPGSLPGQCFGSQEAGRRVSEQTAAAAQVPERRTQK